LKLPLQVESFRGSEVELSRGRDSRIKKGGEDCKFR
jgi:hypothetical protein